MQIISLGTITANFMKSLLWVAVFVAAAVAVMLITEIIFVDFVHGNPHRTQQNAIEMIEIDTPIFCLIAGVGIMIVFAMPQYFQAASIAILLKHFGSRGMYGIAITLPLAAALSWYCYDYLTPSDFNLGINTEPDWAPYQHGLTLRRYLPTLGIQASITLFSLLRLRLQVRDNGKAKKVLMLAMSVASVALGALAGYESALDQYQFL